jgi:hypothetical protein
VAPRRLPDDHDVDGEHDGAAQRQQLTAAEALDQPPAAGSPAGQQGQPDERQGDADAGRPVQPLAQGQPAEDRHEDHQHVGEEGRGGGVGVLQADGLQRVGRPQRQAGDHAVAQLAGRRRPRPAPAGEGQHRGADEEPDRQERGRLDLGDGVLDHHEGGAEEERRDRERDVAAPLPRCLDRGVLLLGDGHTERLAMPSRTSS